MKCSQYLWLAGDGNKYARRYTPFMNYTPSFDQKSRAKTCLAHVCLLFPAPSSSLVVIHLIDFFFLDMFGLPTHKHSKARMQTA